MKHAQVYSRRKGIAVVMALVVMATLAIILSVVTMQIVSQRQMIHQRHRQLQADWLARAGVELAASRLLNNASAFSEEKQDLLPDATVRIVVEKAGEDLYAVTVEAELGAKEEALMVRTASRRFRRTDNGGVVLQAIPMEKEKSK
jgi:hypothetical protein